MSNKKPTKRPLCVICQNHPQLDEYKPFCSKRCADVDLNRWLGGVYAIPAQTPDEEEDETPLRDKGGEHHHPED